MSSVYDLLTAPETWDLVAANYFGEVSLGLGVFADDAIALGDIAREHTIIDIATGPGLLALKAARLARKVVAVDFSAGMIGQVRARVEADRVHNLQPVVADGQALPFAAASFDRAFSLFGIMFFSDRARGFAELARVLRKGGRAIVGSWHALDHVPLMVELFDALRRELPGYPALGESPLGTRESIEREISACGLQALEIHAVEHVFHSPSVETFWESVRRSTAPLVLLRRKIGETAWSNLEDRVVAHLFARFGTGPQRVDLKAWITVGTR